MLPYASTDIYDLVNDVERYPEFLKWCRAAQVMSATEREVTANITLSARNRTETLITRNTLTPGESIALDMIDGPFRHFSGCWTFKALGDGCKVHLWLEFEVKNALLNVLAAPLLNKVADVLVDAFSQRARDLFQPG